jgi:alpha-L-fucosidase
MRVLAGIEAWMKLNRQGIIGSRPWRIFGEGPATEGAALTAQGFNEGRGKPFTSADIRFTTSADTLYAIALGWPHNGRFVVKSLANGSPDRGKIRSVKLLGHAGELDWSREQEGLTVRVPASPPCDYAYVLEIKGLA